MPSVGSNLDGACIEGVSLRIRSRPQPRESIFRDVAEGLGGLGERIRMHGCGNSDLEREVEEVFAILSGIGGDAHPARLGNYLVGISASSVLGATYIDWLLSQ